jgi:hypothetical protein
MEPHRFRAWDLDRKCYYYPKDQRPGGQDNQVGDIKFHFMPEGIKVMICTAADETGSCWDDVNAEFEYSARVPDKDGVDIYEGDCFYYLSNSLIGGRMPVVVQYASHVGRFQLSAGNTPHLFDLFEKVIKKLERAGTIRELPGFFDEDETAK